MTAALRQLSAQADADRRKRPGTPFAERLFRFNWLLLALAITISGIGLFNQYVIAVSTSRNFFDQQLMFVSIGLIGFVLTSLFDLRWLRLLAPLGLLVALGLLIWVDQYGVAFNESQRWIKIGSYTIQPSEMVQLALVIGLAAYFDWLSRRLTGNPMSLLPVCLILGAFAYFIFTQPDLGTTLKLLALSALMIFCAGVRWWLVVLGLVCVAAVFWLAWTYQETFLQPYQIARLTCYLLSDAEISELGSNSPCFQPHQARIAIGGAGIFGHGAMIAPQLESLTIYEPYNDMILAVHAEQFGFIGVIFLLSLVATLVYFGFAVASQCRSQFARLIALGATVNFGLYATINVMMVLSMLPVVGMPFALMSQGGTVTVFTWIGLGLINNAWINRHLVLTPHDQASLKE